MNDERAFERYVADNVASQAGGTPLPDDFYDDMREYTDSHRQPPRWLALLKEPPMRTNSRIAVGSPTAQVAVVMTATMLLLLAFALVGAGAQRLLAASDLIVAQDGSGDYETISAAVAAAVDGDTIVVRQGTYDDSVVTSKDLTIRGDGDRSGIVVINSEGLDPNAQVTATGMPVVFRLEDSAATIENMTLRGESSRIEIIGGAPTLQDMHFDDIGKHYGVDQGSTSVPAGIHVVEGSNATIADSIFSGSTIVIQSGSSPRVIGNEFVPGAIYMDGAGTDPLIEENTIVGAGRFHAVTPWGGAKPVIRRNTISSEEDAINVRDQGFPSNDRGPWPTIEENTISDSRGGIFVAGGEAGADILNNTLIDNRMGISIGRSNPIVRGNDVRGGTAGIVLAGGAPTVEDNTVEGAERGLSIGAGTTTTLEGNTICGNDTNLVLNDAAEVTDLGGNEICEDTAVDD